MRRPRNIACVSAITVALALTLAGCGASNQPSAGVDGPLEVRSEVADVTTVAYLGPQGTYTEEATKIFFGDNDELLLQENVSQTDANKTRFYVVSKQTNSQEGYGNAVFVADISASELPNLLSSACVDGTELVCVHDRPDGLALGSYRYVIELSRDGGFSKDELTRLHGIEQLEYLGSYSRIEG